MAVVYAIAIFLLVASYKSTFGINIEKMDEWAKSAARLFLRPIQDNARLEEWS
jgi:hypothetical protein